MKTLTDLIIDEFYSQPFSAAYKKVDAQINENKSVREQEKLLYSLEDLRLREAIKFTIKTIK